MKCLTGPGDRDEEEIYSDYWTVEDRDHANHRKREARIENLDISMILPDNIHYNIILYTSCKCRVIYEI